MNMETRTTRSQLYTVRLWLEEISDDCWEWRGLVKYVTSGEERYFRDWTTLRHLMLEMLPMSAKKVDGSSLPGDAIAENIVSGSVE